MVELPDDERPATAPRAGAPPGGAVAGAASAALALGVGELVSAMGGADHTLVTSVATSFIDRFAGVLKDLAVSLFGTNDKAALIVGIVVISLALGAVAGRRQARQPWLPVALFVGFAVIGGASGATDPLASPTFTIVAAAAAAAAGLACLRSLTRLAAVSPPASTPAPAPARSSGTPVPGDGPAPPLEDPRRPAASRRAFFGWAGAATAFAAAAAAGSRRFNAQSEVEIARSSITLPRPTNVGPGGGAGAGTTTTLEPVRGPGGEMVNGLSPYFTPNDRFYKIDTAILTPNVDVAGWSLSITGLVDRPFTIGYDELLSMAKTEEAVTIACVSNEIGDTLVGNARWQGVPLRSLLERAGVQKEAGQIVGVSVDGFTAGFPVGALDGDRVALVALGMNGEPLPVAHGFPARLIIAGLYGYVSATKWLKEIRLTTWEGFDGYWMPRGWSKLGPIKTQSRIDVPRSGTAVRAGKVPIAGVAWAPTRGIAKVEVQVDEGAWQEATLGEVVSGNTWRQWLVPWDATPGQHVIRVRATDGTGATQTSQETPPAPDGATGWHTIAVNVEA